MNKVLSKILLLLFRFYKLAISPYLAPACRYTPTCSEYGMQAVLKYGPYKGFYLSMKRLLRCHPWGGHGYDPLP